MEVNDHHATSTTSSTIPAPTTINNPNFTPYVTITHPLQPDHVVIGGGLAPYTTTEAPHPPSLLTLPPPIPATTHSAILQLPPRPVSAIISVEPLPLVMGGL